MSPIPVLRQRERPPPEQWPHAATPLLARLFAARGVSREASAVPALAALATPEALGGLAAACDLLTEAIAAHRRIVVVGDFDCDGATACALAVRGLRLLGATDVLPAVPNRQVHGYGLSPALVEELAALSPELLVTVDHGIACHAGIEAARTRGWKVLVTDHHLPGDALPAAEAIVNPNLRGDAFPSKALAGVGVVFYVLLALRKRLRDAGHESAANADLGSLLDLVAVGTVADLVPLDANNRALVAAGLRRLRAGRGVPGLHALIRVAGREATRLGTADIGFAIAPRLNAAGRLEDMALGIACLLSDDVAEAEALAQRLDAVNRERRVVQERMVADAEVLLADLPAGPAIVPDALCLFDPAWHPGVVGLVASRVKDRVHRPVVAFAHAAPGADGLRGSLRSIPGVHIRDVLAAVDARQPGLIERFGGHAMAAGMSLPRAHLAAFEQAFRDEVSRWLTDDLRQAELWTDGELAPGEFTRATAESLRDGAPWGQHFPEPVFEGVFEVVTARELNGGHLRMEVAMPDGRRVPAIHFGGAGQAARGRQRLAYRLQPDDWRGGDAIQLLVVHREPALADMAN
jgi:single-stranded-DNA-specific exonuclease